MNIIEITDISDPCINMFSSMTESQLRNRMDEYLGIFIAESPKVIKVALDSGYTPIALLSEEKHIYGDARDIIDRIGDIPVYTGSRELLQMLTGYKLTRGVLCAMRRPLLPTPEEICDKSTRLVVIDGVSDTTNIGSIFRAAAALGIDGVLLTRTSCDPLNRRSIRVSMGSVFLVPWTWLDASIESLSELGFKTIAMALTDNSISLSDPVLKELPRAAIVMGTEGDGLAENIIASCDYTVKIPMYHDVDSLNVAAAAAVAFWELSNKIKK